MKFLFRKDALRQRKTEDQVMVVIYQVRKTFLVYNVAEMKEIDIPVHCLFHGRREGFRKENFRKIISVTQKSDSNCTESC